MRSILFIFFLSLTTKAVAPDMPILSIPRSQPVDLYDRLITAVVNVESSGDTLAYNLIEDAYGAFQIRPIRLRDYNSRTGKNYLMKDCYRYNISKEIFLYYAKRIGYPEYETIARQWNGSGSKTLVYWQKVKVYLL